MSRPTPLYSTSNIVPGRFDNAQLTPRTPHSRAGRAEESFSGYELEQVDIDDDDDDVHYGSATQQQNAPLLASSASDSFPPQHGYRSRGDDYDAHAHSPAKKAKFFGLGVDVIMSRLPLALYSSVAAVLLVLVFFSLKEPEKLKEYVVGTTSASADATSVKVDLHQASATATPASAHHHGASAPRPSWVAERPHLVAEPNIELISYANYSTFPLNPLDYRAECIKITPEIQTAHPFWVSKPPRDVLHKDESPDYIRPSNEMPVCRRTMTYQLDGWAGLLTDLALIAQVATLARTHNATFFIMDQFWNRGRWSDYFDDVLIGQPGPEPGCWPPPAEEYVACPRTARHWIINSRTARYHLRHDFHEEYTDPYGRNLNRMKPIFDAAFTSLQHTIQLNAYMKQMVNDAREELHAKIVKHFNTRVPHAGYIGIHARRGDRNRAWQQYGMGRYVPIPDYISAAVDAWTRLGLELPTSTHADNLIQPFVFVASDSPDALKQLADGFAPDRAYSLALSDRPELRKLASPSEYDQNTFMAVKDPIARVQWTRGMVVDFALLSGAWADDGQVIPDALVCTISSVICKFAPVAMGWKRAFGNVDEMGYVDSENKRWVEIDVKGRVVPVWDAFEAP
ncbi:unnamed protein product [Mycena citricolor]|uniref:Uncharacterized protein n=1 Tax=Mycena citricolor TaxID=2018698 RepID=A0AAD2K5W7_9AGAR|nr:unnamed protein product [Mycena citricolor]